MNPEKPIAHPFDPVLEVLKGSSPEEVCKIYGISREELNRRTVEYQQLCRRAAIQDTIPTEKISRNDPCPCGSGKKYKKCCLSIHEGFKRSIPQDELFKREQQLREKRRLEQEIQRGFDLLFNEDFVRARKHAENLLEDYSEDDRLHDILLTSCLALGDYDRAFHIARARWQVALEEKEIFQESGSHRREREGHLVHFYSPSTWLEKFWIAQRARHYRDKYPPKPNPKIKELVEELKVANNLKKFPQRDREGYEVRRKALETPIESLKLWGSDAIWAILPLTYYFSWATLFVPEIIESLGTDDALRLLAELSMFRYPFFAQMCLTSLESFGERSVTIIREIIDDHRAFDELKVGIIMVLGKIPTPESFEILIRLTEHENPYVVNWVAQALANHKNPEALPYLERAKERLGELSKIAGAIKDLANMKAKPI
ncbi:MAG: SEC-C metal-binding domain-containing protein [Syntrophobacterales bacterium]|nr:SEC-C metal-binding domain-containing protein [Syntrophobacterales bacterium]